MNLKDFILSTPDLKDAQEIVFFGGSFNPWHEGHSACVRLLPKDKALIILPDHNPYKEVVDSKVDVLKELKDITSSLNPNAHVYDEFLKAKRKNPTYYWLEALKRELPRKEFSLLLGFDSFTGIDKWIEAPSLLVLLHKLYVVSRLDNPSAKTEQVKRLKSFNPRLEINFLGGHPYEALSSTEIRESK